MRTTTSAVTRDVEKYRKFLKSGMPGPHAYVVLLGVTHFDWPSVLAQIEKGLPATSVERFGRNTGFSLEETLQLISIAKRTFMRRKQQGRLSPEESDRLIRASRVFATALHLFAGDVDDTREWLTDAQRAFGGITPAEMTRSDIGAHEVERLVFQLLHGVLP